MPPGVWRSAACRAEWRAWQRVEAAEIDGQIDGYAKACKARHALDIGDPTTFLLQPGQHAGVMRV